MERSFQFHMMGWVVWSKKSDRILEVCWTRQAARHAMKIHRHNYLFNDAVVRHVSILDEGR